MDELMEGTKQEREGGLPAATHRPHPDRWNHQPQSSVMTYGVEEVPEARFSYEVSPMSVIVKKTGRRYVRACVCVCLPTCLPDMESVARPSVRESAFVRCQASQPPRQFPLCPTPAGGTSL